MQHQDRRQTLAYAVAAWLPHENVLGDAARRLVLLHEQRRKDHKVTGAVEIWEIARKILVTTHAPPQLDEARGGGGVESQADFKHDFTRSENSTAMFEALAQFYLALPHFLVLR
jgi:hypothetical protein